VRIHLLKVTQFLNAPDSRSWFNGVLHHMVHDGDEARIDARSVKLDVRKRHVTRKLLH
jgi:hypothetical protein